MEDGHAPGGLEPVHPLVDLADLQDAELLFDVGQGAVIRRDHVIAVGRLRHAGPAGRAHPGVHHRHVDGALGPEGKALQQPIAGGPGIVLRDLVGAVEDLQLPIHGLDHAVHGADRALLVGEIRLEDQDRLVEHTHIVSSYATNGFQYRP